ncbi:MAG TPA: hypothetical protein VF944_08220 [Candidatus Bathyarchaeia archaeon]
MKRTGAIVSLSEANISGALELKSLVAAERATTSLEGTLVRAARRIVEEAV